MHLEEINYCIGYLFIVRINKRVIQIAVIQIRVPYGIGTDHIQDRMGHMEACIQEGYFREIHFHHIIHAIIVIKKLLVFRTYKTSVVGIRDRVQMTDGCFNTWDDAPLNHILNGIQPRGIAINIPACPRPICQIRIIQRKNPSIVHIQAIQQCLDVGIGLVKTFCKSCNGEAQVITCFLIGRICGIQVNAFWIFFDQIGISWIFHHQEGGLTLGFISAFRDLDPCMTRFDGSDIAVRVNTRRIGVGYLPEIGRRPAKNEKSEDLSSIPCLPAGKYHGCAPLVPLVYPDICAVVTIDPVTASHVNGHTVSGKTSGDALETEVIGRPVFGIRIYEKGVHIDDPDPLHRIHLCMALHYAKSHIRV